VLLNGFTTHIIYNGYMRTCDILLRLSMVTSSTNIPETGENVLQKYSNVWNSSEGFIRFTKRHTKVFVFDKNLSLKTVLSFLPLIYGACRLSNSKASCIFHKQVVKLEESFYISS
jgi:hypothetical protein